MDHRWSGWPGAWCLDCGVPDPYEECLAHDKVTIICKYCGEEWPQGICNPTGGEHNAKTITCDEHSLTKCTEPGSKRHDPYAKPVREIVHLTPIDKDIIRLALRGDADMRRYAPEVKALCVKLNISEPQWFDDPVVRIRVEQ